MANSVQSKPKRGRPKTQKTKSVKPSFFRRVFTLHNADVAWRVLMTLILFYVFFAVAPLPNISLRLTGEGLNGQQQSLARYVSNQPETIRLTSPTKAKLIKAYQTTIKQSNNLTPQELRENLRNDVTEFSRLLDESDKKSVVEFSKMIADKLNDEYEANNLNDSQSIIKTYKAIIKGLGGRG